jgi:hypothetical protein
MFREHSGVVLPTTVSHSVKCVAPFLRLRPMQRRAVSAKLQMKVIFLCLIVLLGLSLRTNAQTSFVITHVAIIDVIKGVVDPDKSILVTGNLISRVGTSADLHPPEGVRVVDAHGQFLIPGTCMFISAMPLRRHYLS